LKFPDGLENANRAKMARANMLGIVSPFPKARGTELSSSTRSTTSCTSPPGPDPGTGLQWPPFRNFGDQFYTYQILLDVKVEEGLAMRIEPHPRFYTDQSDTAPIAVPALLRRWWPMMNFAVFKSPAEGRTHIFRPGEPFAQIIVIPAESDFELVEMNEEEAAERELQSRRIHESRDTLSANTKWVSSTSTVFDGTYRHLLSAAKAKSKKQQD
jgi:hypothetical protein